MNYVTVVPERSKINVSEIRLSLSITRHGNRTLAPQKYFKYHTHVPLRR